MNLHIVVGALIIVIIVLLLLLNRKKEELISAERRIESMEAAAESLRKKAETLQISAERRIESMEATAESLRKKAETLQNARVEDQRDYAANMAQIKALLQIAQKSNESLERKVTALSEEKLQHEDNLKRILSSNLSSIPWLAGMMADYLTYDLLVEAQKLNWGSNIQRKKKVASLLEIRKDTKARIEAAKVATYQLEYLRQLFPDIDDILSTEYRDLDLEGHLKDGDPTRWFLSQEEWNGLSASERNQLALDRYISSRKSDWQIGRDYELAVAYEYRNKGYVVDTVGSYKKLEDLGRDLIAEKGEVTLIIQCKYWSNEKTIHEKHIFQLYGTLICFCLENGRTPDSVKGVFVTKTHLSTMAKKVADYLNIAISENHPMVDFPRIKCNLGKDEFGWQTKIYHLPMDDQYDKTKIEKAGEFYAFTVREAEKAGFRRAYKWHGE